MTLSVLLFPGGLTAFTFLHLLFPRFALSAGIRADFPGYRHSPLGKFGSMNFKMRGEF